MSTRMIGMLWRLTAEDLPLEDKIKQATGYYATKYGEAPTAGYMNPVNLPEETKIAEVNLKPSRSIQVGHLVIGVA